jgi:rhodanese-related sulfurtransferase
VHATAFLALVRDAKSRIRELTVEQVAQKMQHKERFHLVDTREESEWAAGHVRGAMQLSKGILERDIEAKIPDKGAEIVLYCGGGFRSALAADNLQKMGYTNVYSMDGGWKGWRALDLPTE